MTFSYCFTNFKIIISMTTFIGSMDNILLKYTDGNIVFSNLYIVSNVDLYNHTKYYFSIWGEISLKYMPWFPYDQSPRRE